MHHGRGAAGGQGGGQVLHIALHGRQAEFGVELHAPGLGADAVGLVGLMGVASQAHRAWGQGTHGLGVYHLGRQLGGQVGKERVGLGLGREGDGHGAQLQPAWVVADFAPIAWANSWWP